MIYGRTKKRRTTKNQFPIRAKRNAKRLNPLFPKQKSKFQSKVIAVFLFLFSVWFVGFIIFSHKVQITTIEIDAPSIITKEKAHIAIKQFLNTKKWHFIPGTNILFFSKQELTRNLHQQFQLEELDIKRKFFHTLQVMMKERVSEINLITQNRRFLVDDRGVVIKEIPQIIELSDDFEQIQDLQDVVIEKNEQDNTEVSQNNDTKENLPEPSSDAAKLPVINFFEKKMIMDENTVIVYDLANTSINLNEQIFSKQWIDDIISITNHLRLLTPAKILYFTMKDIKEGSLTVETSEGWRVLFELNTDIERQLENFELVYNEKFSTSREGLEYIDLRFGERVYYK